MGGSKFSSGNAEHATIWSAGKIFFKKDKASGNCGRWLSPLKDEGK